MARRKRPNDVTLEPTYFRDWRKFRKLTLEQVADQMGIDPTSISRLERGEAPYDQYSLQQLATIYRCSIPELLYSDPIRPKPDEELAKLVGRLYNPEHKRAVKAMIEVFLAKNT